MRNSQSCLYFKYTHTILQLPVYYALYKAKLLAVLLWLLTCLFVYVYLKFIWKLIMYHANAYKVALFAGAISYNELSMLQSGDEIVKPVSIGGKYPQTTDKTIRLRLCDNDYQVYLSSTTYAFSGYCIGIVLLIAH